MSIYIDESFDAATLSDLKRQVAEEAERQWRWHLQNEAWSTYRALAREDVAAGRTVAEDHPDLHPSTFEPRKASGYYDLTGAGVLDIWERACAESLKVPSIAAIWPRITVTGEPPTLKIIAPTKEED